MKLVKESLNEGRFSCTTDDLYEAVKKYVENKLHYPKGQVKVSNNGDYVIVDLKVLTSQNTSWANNSDDEMVRRIKSYSENFKSYFNHFKDFCTSGLRGVADLFRKENNMIRINSTAKLDKIRLVADKNGFRRTDKKIYRYTETRVDDLGDADQYIQRYGKENLDVLYITVGLFLKDVYDH